MASALEDPTLELYDSHGAVIATNDDWRENQPAIEASGAPPHDDREAAIVAALAPGNYTGVLRGKNAAAGVALFEAYNLR